MVKKQVNIANVKTMADGSIRVTIDLLNGNSTDFKELFELQREETTMVVAPTEHFNAIFEESAQA